MGAVTASKRLTWDTAFPAPFESIWSIILKAIVFNNLTLNELTNLIKRKDLRRWPVRATIIGH